MARNGSGTYTVPNTFTSGTSITASSHNANWSDIGSEITNSVAVDGQSTMTGQLKAASGSAASPSIAFGADTDTGLYRIGSNNIGVAVGGTKILDVASSGETITGTLTVSSTGTFGGAVTVTGAVDATVIKQGTYRLVPAGVMVPYGGSSAPDGWLLCYGQAVSRTTYADLFTAFSTTYGVGDGSTTFNLPDMRGRVVAGKDDMGGSSANRLTDQTDGVNGDTLGDTGGTETHTLTEAQIAAHTHTGTTSSDGAHTHTYSKATVGTANPGWDDTASLLARVTAASDNTGSGGAHTHTFTSASTGGGAAHNNVQPTIILNYIVKY